MQTRTSIHSANLRRLLPSSVGSLVVHVLVFVITATSLRGCQKGQTGEAGGEVFREIGLFPVDGSDTEQANDSVREGVGADDRQQPEPAQQVVTPPQDQSVSKLLPQQAPDLSTLLNDRATESSAPTSTAADSKLPRIIGPGTPLAAATHDAGSDGLISPPADPGGRTGAATGVLGPGQTAFMEIADTGRSFVYLIDVSGSMREGNRLAKAKSQLKASIRLLQPNQQFQIIFYSERPERMNLRRAATNGMYYATAANLMLAANEIDRVQPREGTEHRPALTDALTLSPDVIYFLTDGTEPRLSPGELRDLARIQGKTTIHVIEFGDGSLSSRETSWLERLARQANGEYRLFVVGDR